MATVELSFTPLPAHVRTARLVATAVARRSGVEESMLDEVRLAVGEACSRAVEAHRLHCPAEPVRIQLSDREGRFEVVVTDAVPRSPADTAAFPHPEEAYPDEAYPAEAHAAIGMGGTASAHGTVRGVAVAASAGPESGREVLRAGGISGQEISGRDTSGRDSTGTAAEGIGAGCNFPAGIGFAVIAGLADDVQIAATSEGVRILMSWPLEPQ